MHLEALNACFPFHILLAMTVQANQQQESFLLQDLFSCIITNMLHWKSRPFLTKRHKQTFLYNISSLYIIFFLVNKRAESAEFLLRRVVLPLSGAIFLLKVATKTFQYRFGWRTRLYWNDPILNARCWIPYFKWVSPCANWVATHINTYSWII